MSHPPRRATAATRESSAVKHPGIDGPRWRAHVEEIVTAAGENAEKMRKSIEFWNEHLRHDPAGGE